MKIIDLLLVAAGFLASIWFYPRLPEMLPVHWNFQGQVDNYMLKAQAVWLMPGLTLAILILFQIMPKLDPKQEKYKLFRPEWELIKSALITFFLYLHLVIIYISLNPGIPLLPFMFFGLGALFILLGNYLSKVRQNYFIGIKVPWTLANEENWNKTHRFASWTFVIAGLATLIEAWLVWYAPFIIFSSILLATVLPIIYSYLLFKKAEGKMKYVFYALAFLVLLLAFLRVFAGEDDWICSGGQWIAHGKPAFPPPEVPCR